MFYVFAEMLNKMIDTGNNILLVSQFASARGDLDIFVSGEFYDYANN